VAKTKHNDKPALPADKFIPVAIDTAANRADVDNAERIVIFTIDGVEYDMPKVERADLALKYIELGEENASEAATYLLEQTIGPDAVSVLASVVGLKGSQFEGVMTRVQAIALPKARTSRKDGARR
jgi:hypothetical protein